MVEKDLDRIQSQMRRGVLEYSVLIILNKNDAYTSSLIEELKEAKMIVVEGTIYPLLTRLKNQGVLSYRWEESPQGPPRKYYSITEKGERLLQELDSSWGELRETILLLKEKRED